MIPLDISIRESRLPLLRSRKPKSTDFTFEPATLPRNQVQSTVSTFPRKLRYLSALLNLERSAKTHLLLLPSRPTRILRFSFDPQTMRALRKKHSERKQSLTVNTQTANEGPGENDDDVFDAIFTANSRSFDSQSVDVSSRPVLHRSLSVGDILSKPKPPASVHSNASDDFVLGSPGPSEADLEEAECQAAYENLYTIAKGRGYSEDEVLGIVDHICSNNLFDDQGNVVFDLKAFRRDGSPEQPGEEEFHELADNSLVAKEIERYLLLGIYGPGVPSTRALLANPQPKSDPNARFDKLHSKRRHRYFNLRSRHRHPIYALHKSGISPMATIKAQPTPPTSPTGLSDNKAAPASHGEETKAVRTSSGSDDNDKTPTPSIYQLHNDAHTVKEAGESHGSSADVLTIPSTRIEPPAPQRIDSKLSSPVDGNFAFAPPLSSSPSYGEFNVPADL